MGFFSFKTADTQESIANEYSGKEVKPVYLLQPNGLPAIKEPCYSGYGVFGGVDCYEWLAKINFGEGASRSLAISADCGHYFEDDKAYYACGMHLTEQELRSVVPDKAKPVVIFDRYDTIINNGKSANDYREKGLWERREIGIKYPLKFSFDANARYEDLDASERCEFQGYFYD